MNSDAVWRLLPVHSVMSAVLKEWSLGVLCAAFMGLMVYRIRRSATSKWVWVLSALWFGFRAIPYAARSGMPSVLGENSGFWFHFSGAACGVEVSSCRDFCGFTVPLIRALSYSGSALLASRILKPPPSHIESNINTTTEGNEDLTNS
jgi:hypothetical protein